MEDKYLDKAWMEASRKAYHSPGALDDEDAYVRVNGHLGRTSDPEFKAISRDNYRHATEIGQDKSFAHMPAKGQI